MRQRIRCVAVLGLPSWGGATSLCARSRGEPSSAHCEQRLSERLTPCPCDPVCAYVLNGFFTRCRWKRVAGLRRLRAEVVARPPASSGESPHAHTGRRRKSHWHPLPAYPHAAQRAVPGWRGGLGRVGADLASAGSMRPPPSPARHVSTARHAPQTPGNKRQRETPPHQPADKPTAKSSCLVTLFHSEFKHS